MAANSSFLLQPSGLVAFNYICLGIYKSAIYFISIFFLLPLLYFKNFFLCLVFLFIHYSSVTSYLDLVAWFLNSLGELNLFQKFKKNLIILGELNLWRSQNSTPIFSIIQHFFIFLVKNFH